MIDIIKQLFLQNTMMSLKMSVIVILLLCFTKLVTRRYTAGWRYYSWLAVMIVFLIPFGNLGMNYKIDAAPTFIEIQNSTREISTWVNEHIPTYQVTQEVPVTEDIKPDISVETTPKTSVVTYNNPIDYMLILSLLWLIVAIIYFALHIKRYAFFKSAVKRCTILCSDTVITDILLEEKQKLKISANIPIRISKLTYTPVLTGIFHPIILLPSNEYSSDELHLIFRHELIHYKRKDVWYQFIILVFMSLHWFNPIAYMMESAATLDGETSCDEAVLKENTYDTRIYYGEMILKFLKTTQQKKSYLTTTFFGGKRGMKKRLTLIKSKNLRKKGTVAMVVLIALTVMTSVCVAAMDSDLLKSIFDGDTSYLNDSVQTPKQSVTDGRYTFTLEQYLVSKYQALILYSIEGLTDETIDELNKTNEKGYSDFFDMDTISFGPVDWETETEFPGWGSGGKHTELDTKSKKYFKIICTSLLNEDEKDFFIRFNKMQDPQKIIIPMKSNVEEKNFVLGGAILQYTPVGITFKKTVDSSDVDLYNAVNGLYFRMRNNEVKTFTQLLTLYGASNEDENLNRVEVDSLFNEIVPLSEFKSIIVDNVEYDINNTTKTKAFTPDKSITPFEMKPYCKNHLWLPIREFCENVGAEIKWNGETHSATVKYRGSTYVFTVGSTEVKINGEIVDYYDKLNDETTFIDENGRMIVTPCVFDNMKVRTSVANENRTTPNLPVEQRIWLVIP